MERSLTWPLAGSVIPLSGAKCEPRYPTTAPVSNILSRDGTEGLIWAFEKVPGPVGDGGPVPTSEAETHFVRQW